MSVGVHEAFCLDSFQDRLLFWDDFEGDQIKDEWYSNLVSGGTAAVIDAQTGGIVRLSSPTASDTAEINWGDIKTLLVTKKVSLEVRARANGGVTDTRRTLLLVSDGNNWLGFYQEYDSTTIKFYSTDGGSSTNVNAGTMDADWHIYRIECHTHGGNHVHFYIDETECANSPISTNVPDDAGDFLEPKLRSLTNADTDPATSFDIDYVYIRQER